MKSWEKYVTSFDAGSTNLDYMRLGQYFWWHVVYRIKMDLEGFVVTMSEQGHMQAGHPKTRGQGMGLLSDT